MDYIRVPSRLKKGEHVYRYKEQINDSIYLYEEEKLKYKECFLLQDLVKINNKQQPEKGKKGARTINGNS